MPSISRPAVFVAIAAILCIQSSMGAPRAVLPKGPSSVQAPATTAAPLVGSINDFGLNLFRQCSSSGNLLISPYSIYAAFGMVYAGARSSTERQMARVMLIGENQKSEFSKNMHDIGLHLSFLEKEGVNLRVANALWIDDHYPVLPPYLAQMKSDFRASIQHLDFKNNPNHCVGIINQWIDEKTKGKIQNLLSKHDISTLTKLVLADAVYFKGKWVEPFDSGKTKEKPFCLANGDSIKTRMMNRHFNRLSYFENDSLQLLQIRYKGSSMEMVVILPKKGVPLSSVERMATAGNIDAWLAGAHSREVDLELPKFKMDNLPTIELNSLLSDMGMTLPFTKDADFSSIHPIEPLGALKIDKALHKAFIEVNEEGTEVAAVTVIAMASGDAFPAEPPVIVSFIADHPFLFLIRDTRMGCYLFAGRLANPAAR